MGGRLRTAKRAGLFIATTAAFGVVQTALCKAVIPLFFPDFPIDDTQALEKFMYNMNGYCGSAVAAGYAGFEYGLRH
jgi:hypothetical protein